MDRTRLDFWTNKPLAGKLPVSRGSATEVTMRAVFKTKEQRDEVIERYGALEGGRQTLGRLAAYIAKLVAGRS